MKQSFLDSLLAEVQTRFYVGVPDRTFYSHRRGLIRALTWPAVWWRQRGFRTEITPELYRSVLTEVFVGIKQHGDPSKFGEGAFFPAYLLRCIQQHYGHHGESLYNHAKPMRDGVAPGDAAARSFALGSCADLGAIVRHATRNAPAAAAQSLDLDVLTQARELVAVKRKPAKTVDPAQPDLFG